MTGNHNESEDKERYDNVYQTPSVASPRARWRGLELQGNAKSELKVTLQLPINPL